MGPKFLCIGAMKAGTGWLHKNLEAHPELWLPPVKELHYLDHIGQLNERLPIIFQDDTARKRGRRYAGSQLRRLRRLQKPDRLAWALRYFLQPPTARWYGSLFPAGPRLAGECTPSYAMAPNRSLRRLKKMSPDVKLILLLRNPLYRDWSHAAMAFRHQAASIDKVSDRKILHVLQHVHRTGRSDYLPIIRRWHRHFPPENMFFGFHEEIKHDPDGLLLRIFQFLGVDPSRKFLTRLVAKRVGKGSYRDVPDRFLSYLATLHHDRIAEMDAYFNNPYTREWLELARTVKSSTEDLERLGLDLSGSRRAGRRHRSSRGS